MVATIEAEMTEVIVMVMVMVTVANVTITIEGEELMIVEQDLDLIIVEMEGKEEETMMIIIEGNEMTAETETLVDMTEIVIVVIATMKDRVQFNRKTKEIRKGVEVLSSFKLNEMTPL